MIILGLGSNLNNRIHYLKEAIDLIKKSILTSIVYSPCYMSAALLPEDAPTSWDLPFLNMAVAGKSSLPPDALLAAIKHIEKTVGRMPRSSWAPREIDIDILAYDDLVVDTPTLQIPHKGLTSRAFALFPLADITPDWIHPVLHQPAHALRDQLMQSDQGATRRTEDILA